ncbi:hypothetical protein [Paenibacillus sp. P22]|uniref:hypothetical protein n=1 Tax=Paenibacillus sp. P22 TaxID=483908 RepID=UPI0003F82C9D|nr:hypothetical protein [Paenibacillus sp. P22]
MINDWNYYIGLGPTMEWGQESEGNQREWSRAAAAADTPPLAQKPKQTKGTEEEKTQNDDFSSERHYAVVNSGLHDSVRPNREKASPALYVIRGGKSL